jgi:WD40 repeat protein
MPKSFNEERDHSIAKTLISIVPPFPVRLRDSFGFAEGIERECADADGAFPGAHPLPANHPVYESAGGSYACAVTAEGGLKCWGSNAQGQLGNGSGTDEDLPMDVSGLTSGVVSVSAGWYHTCAPTDNYRIFDLSPDGKYIAYLEYSSTDYSIKVADLEGGSEGGDIQGILLFHDALEDDGSYVPIVGDLSFSPDEARLLFVHSEKGIATLRLFSSGAASPIVLARLTDCTVSEETTGPQSNVACWSPNWKSGWSSDGQWIVYATAIMGHGRENGDIYILNVYQAETGSINPVLQAEHGRRPCWQPAG